MQWLPFPVSGNWSCLFPKQMSTPHFERSAFRVKKKIFATLSEKKHSVNLKLTLVDRSVFCVYNPAVIHPVAGGWSRMGYTTVHLKKVRRSIFKDALTTAYCTAAPKKLAKKYLKQ